MGTLLMLVLRMTGFNAGERHPKWKTVRTTRVIPKVKIFLWRALHATTDHEQRRQPKKRPPPPSSHQPSPATKHQATAPTPPQPFTEEDFVNEDVFIDETLLGEEDVESLILRDFEEHQAFSSRLSKWARPPLSNAYISQSRSIVFQQLEIDYVTGESNRDLVPDSSGPAAIIRIFGVTREGIFFPKILTQFVVLFMGLSHISTLAALQEWVPMIYPVFIKPLRMKEMNRNSKVPKFVRRVVLVQKRSIMYYQQQKSQPFLKIVVALPTMVTSCRGILDRGIQIDGLGVKGFMTYESNILFALRFMIDCNIVGGNWIEIPAGKHKKTAKNMSYCQLEFDCFPSFDIECAGHKGHFPEPTHDPVIQVANLVTLQGEDQPFVRNVMTLKSCSPIVGVDVMSFNTEKEVLIAWKVYLQEFIREVDPDLIIGYNICKFDLPYLIERAQTLGIAEFPILGRIRNSRVRVKDTTFSSRQYGTRESKEVTVEGRVQFDLIQAMQRDYKLSSYSLNSVSAHFLSEQKEDVHHSIISDLQNGNAETRRRLAVYCLKDAYLPQRLLDKLMLIYNYVEMARVTGVPISFLLSRGQSIKVLSQLFRKSKQKNLVIPNVKHGGSEQGTYEGATVLEAKAGFYEKPIATLDFASLYPSIMMAYNLCYCTLVTPEDVRKLNLPPECVNKTPFGETFVKPNLQKEAKDPLEKAVLDGRQLALKVSANSVYGFTGATVGQLPCLEISSSVTSYDSVMVQFGVLDVEAAMNLGREAAEYIHKIQYVKYTISDLLMNRMDLSLLVITKRDAATAPNFGDRVPYVIIKATKGAKAYERSEDPIYVLENNIPIDPQYYLENQISKPLLRIFEPILKNASKELLHGSHTRSISISSPSNSGIMKFAKKQLSCIGCKALISNTDRTLCSHCKGREAELYYKTVSQVSELEELFGRLWTQCQECQGSLHQDVLCTGFYYLLSLCDS
ncbi:hypothetical protein REPUB_Repub18cG0022900 [Reevesia pubescens]